MYACMHARIYKQLSFLCMCLIMYGDIWGKVLGICRPLRRIASATGVSGLEFGGLETGAMTLAGMNQ